jgi:hypothetical protein
MYETREVRKARERAQRATRRADRAARRVHDAQERAAGRPASHQLIDAAGDAATAALTAVSAAADEAQAKLAAKARMRELEHAVITVRAGGQVDVSPPTREEALKLADRMESGAPEASFVRGMGLIFAGIAALLMIIAGGFGWLGVAVPVAIMIAGGSIGDRLQLADRSSKAGRIQLELARASLVATGDAARAVSVHPAPRVQLASGVEAPAETAPTTTRPRLLEDGNPRTRADVLAVLDRLVANVRGHLGEADAATLGRIHDSAAIALPTTDGPLDLTDHETWLVRQICIDYLPGALEHYIALPPDFASEPVLDGRSARQVLDEQLALIENRLEAAATRTYQRDAGGLLDHARFVADSLRPDPFQARLAELATSDAERATIAAPESTRAAEASATGGEATDQTREHA